MKNKELLILAGWIFISNYAGLDLYARTCERVLYRQSDDSVYLHYSVKEKELHKFSEEEFKELLK